MLHSTHSPSSIRAFDFYSPRPGSRVHEQRPRLEILEDRTAPAAGLLDPTFGLGGLVITNFGGDSNDWLYAMTRQPDGKILVAGTTRTDGTWANFALARYTASGALDPTFGDSGKVITDLGAGSTDEAYDLILQPDGKILVAGDTPIWDGTGYNFALVRYTASGALDPTFGEGGKVITNFAADSSDGAYALALQPDGKILVAGETYQDDDTGPNFALVRYTASGALDPTFGEGGKVVTDLGASRYDWAYALTLQPDGKILVAGETYINLFNFALVRYTASGALDPSFGDGGKVITDLGAGSRDHAYAMTLQPDGKILVAGETYQDDDTGSNFALVRYTASGALDPTFGEGGKVITNFAADSSDGAYALALQPDGKILVAGSTEANFALVRYTVSGALDPTFGAAGLISTIFGPGSIDVAHAMTLQPDGKILVAGSTSTTDGTGSNFALARYFSYDVPPPVVRVSGSHFVYVRQHNQLFSKPVSAWAYSPTGLPLHYELVGAIPTGVRLSANKQMLTYRRPASFHGDVQIRFRISDGLHRTRILTITLKEPRVRVNPAPPVPLSLFDQVRVLAAQLASRLHSRI